MLELAQINRNKIINFSRVRIDEIVFNAVYQVKTKYAGRKIVPKIQYPESENDLVINGNEGLLTIAFKNILDNACKFSNDDVSVEFEIYDKYINVLISDNGIGIPADELETIHRPFSRASNVKFIGGFGIGLSLVSRIMELHGAEMKIRSKVNEGTRIEMIFRHSSG